MNITVYCGASLGNNPQHQLATEQLGKWIAERGHTLVYGGGRSGLMGLLADTVLAHGGKVIGIMPTFLQNRELAHTGLTEMITVESMSERKAQLVERGDAYIALAGGPGTLEEIVEVISWARIGKNHNPCILFNQDNYYQPLKAMFSQMVEQGFLTQADFDKTLFSDDLTEIEQFIANYTPPDIRRSYKESERIIMKETIVAQATPIGRGGIGILRVSGPLASQVATAVLGKCPKPRMADYLPFKDEDGTILDQGIALFFKAPNSFTGEDVLELQGHGGQVILDMLLNRILKIDGIRIARAGEFSEQAFLNDKLDLAQAEAIADLIDATSEQAARSALKSLQGEFSNKINQLVDNVIYLRTYVEAAIDFPDEEIDFLADGKIEAKLNEIITQLASVRQEAKQGTILREGMKVVIAGKPNAGKSSLLNALAGRDAAIVTDIAGTTRDVLREHIHIDGMPLHIIDTAGLRDASDEVEKIGIKRAWDEIEQADQVLLMIDSQQSQGSDFQTEWADFLQKLPKNLPLAVIRNKVDLTGEQESLSEENGFTVIRLSAQTKVGVDLLREHLKKSMGYQSSTEGGFIARRRHLVALETAAEHLERGHVQLTQFFAGELLAEELRLVQNALSEITGQFTSDDLLGNIFSSFCIGK